MKAIIADEFGPIEKMHWSDVSTPEPEENEVQIQISYTGVNPVDWKIVEGWLKKLLPHEFPLIPGWDAAGVVSKVGKNVTKFSIGDEVYAYCRKAVVKEGTYAQYICFNAEHVAHKPKKLSFSQAAAIPLVGLTAWQAIFDAANLKKGETVLIHAGAGGVGSLAIQFAKHIGAKIYTTASERNHDYVKKLGADVLIDYTRQDFVKEIFMHEPDGVDVVVDCTGGETLNQSYEVVKRGGRLISIVHHLDETLCEIHGITGYFVFVRPDGEQLKTIGDLIDSDSVIAPDITEYPVEDYLKALNQIKTHHTRGKIVLKIS